MLDFLTTPSVRELYGRWWKLAILKMKDPFKSTPSPLIPYEWTDNVTVGGDKALCSDWLDFAGPLHLFRESYV